MIEVQLHAMLGVIAAAMLVTSIRLARGPSLADRVVAIDTITMLGVVFACLTSVAYRTPWPFDAALIIALVAFLSTAAFARYVADRARGQRGRS